MFIYLSIYMVLLFLVLTPGIIIRVPGNKYLVALIHAIVFSITWYFTNTLVSNLTQNW
jgi:hypothetical protein